MFLTFALTVAVATPILVLVHELGHAAVGLVATEGLVRVSVGQSPGLVRGRIGRLEFELHPLVPRKGPSGLAQTFAMHDPSTALLSALAGPFANLVLGALMLPVIVGTQGTEREVAFAIAFSSFAMAIMNILPMTVGGHRTDGRRILDEWSRRHQRLDESARELADTKARWLALFSNVPGDLKTRGRGMRLTYGAGIVANVPATDGALRRDYAQIALAGWCWRHVEHGDPEVLTRELCAAGADVPPDAMDSERLPVEIALRFLASGGRPADGSPGATAEKREAFLTEAVTIMRNKTKLNPLLVEHAFLFGVVLHDAEQFVG